MEEDKAGQCLRAASGSGSKEVEAVEAGRQVEGGETPKAREVEVHVSVWAWHAVAETQV